MHVLKKVCLTMITMAFSKDFHQFRFGVFYQSDFSIDQYMAEIRRKRLWFWLHLYLSITIAKVRYPLVGYFFLLSTMKILNQNIRGAGRRGFYRLVTDLISCYAPKILLYGNNG